MNRFAGIAQLRERRSTLPEVAGEIPAPRSILQALAAGLQRDPVAFETGRLDGATDRWRVTEADILGGAVDVVAYASGFNDGRRGRRNSGG